MLNIINKGLDFTIQIKKNNSKKLIKSNTIDIIFYSLIIFILI